MAARATTDDSSDGSSPKDTANTQDAAGQTRPAGARTITTSVGAEPDADPDRPETVKVTLSHHLSVDDQGLPVRTGQVGRVAAKHYAPGDVAEFPYEVAEGLIRTGRVVVDTEDEDAIQKILRGR
jgi:hypothetical protein